MIHAPPEPHPPVCMWLWGPAAMTEPAHSAPSWADQTLLAAYGKHAKPIE